MDGLAGYKTAAVEAIEAVVTVMEPFHDGGPGRGQTRPLPPTRPTRDPGVSRPLG